MIAFYILIILSLILSFTFVITWSPRHPLISFLLKGLASLGVLSLAIVALAVNHLAITLHGAFTLAALAACMIGDLVLALLELCDSTRRQDIINGGISAFALAQILFIAGLMTVKGFTFWPFLFGLAFGAGIFLLRKPMRLDFGKCLWPAVIYGGLLATTLGTAFAVMIMTNFSNLGIMMTVGFFAFLMSDLLLSTIYFGDRKNQSMYFSNLGSYYASITLIACALVLTF